MSRKLTIPILKALYQLTKKNKVKVQVSKMNDEDYDAAIMVVNRRGG